MLRQLRLATPGTKISVNPGDQIRIDVEFTYSGPAWRETLYGALYKGVEDEVSGSAGTSSLDIPECKVPTQITGAYVVIPVPNRPGETCGVLTKLGNIAKAKIPDVVEILTPPTVPQIANLTIYKYTAKPWRGADCYVYVMFDYKGPAVTRQLYAALGNIEWYGFDEYLSAITSIDIAAASNWATRLATVKIPIPTTARLGVYDLYAKVDSIQSPIYENVVEIIP